MQFIKVKFLKNGQAAGRQSTEHIEIVTKAAGRACTYRSPVEVKPGDKVELPSGKHAVVVDEPVDAAWIQVYGADKIQEIVGKAEEK